MVGDWTQRPASCLPHPPEWLQQSLPKEVVLLLAGPPLAHLLVLAIGAMGMGGKCARPARGRRVPARQLKQSIGPGWLQRSNRLPCAGEECRRNGGWRPTPKSQPTHCCFRTAWGAQRSR